MNHKNLTQHAQMRMQQRGISQMQIELLRQFGKDYHQKGGCVWCYIPEKQLSLLRKAIDKMGNLAMVKDSEEGAITVMHVTKRVKKTNYAA